MTFCEKFKNSEKTFKDKVFVFCVFFPSRLDVVAAIDQHWHGEGNHHWLIEQLWKFKTDENIFSTIILVAKAKDPNSLIRRA